MRISLEGVEYEKEGTKIIKGMTCSFTTGITNIVGKNGSGKSSLLKLIATAIQPAKGTICYRRLMKDNGLYRKQLNVDEIRTMIGYMPQEFSGYPEMTIERYLKYMAYHKGIPYKIVKSTLEKWLEESGLAKLKRRKLRSLSGGQLKKVGLIQTLINQPRICILDEPFEGLDIAERLYFQRTIQRLSFHSIVLISTHIMDEIIDGDFLYMEEGNIARAEGNEFECFGGKR
ncbi:ATP-binding cassette domain-containing protein [Bacillus niameyensis]|uniref:ATP-binding cassette domain-containing protein n=1 Tax=Bacillus niameyensis TaxID=1522308 RepID=UPI0007814ED2|nr:ATP-binding cassette domain-containing protein [Bacillus niameyensis]